MTPDESDTSIGDYVMTEPFQNDPFQGESYRNDPLRGDASRHDPHVATHPAERNRNLLIIAGTLVGASGTMLTILMGRAMNRPLRNVLFGAFGAGGGMEVAASKGGQQNIRSVSVDDAAVMLAYAHQVIIVPGYGMAVAQAQHSVRELADQLEKHGVTVYRDGQKHMELDVVEIHLFNRMDDGIFARPMPE